MWPFSSAKAKVWIPCPWGLRRRSTYPLWPWWSFKCSCLLQEQNPLLSLASRCEGSNVTLGQPLIRSGMPEKLHLMFLVTAAWDNQQLNFMVELQRITGPTLLLWAPLLPSVAESVLFLNSKSCAMWDMMPCHPLTSFFAPLAIWFSACCGKGGIYYKAVIRQLCYAKPQ